MKLFKNKCNWKGINNSSGQDDCKRFEKNNPTVPLYVLYVEKNEYTSCLHFKTRLKSQKLNHSFSDSKWRMIMLSWNKIIIIIIKKNSFKT